MTAWIRRQINSLTVRLLWPAALMMIVMVAALTGLVTRAYTETILEQEAARTQSAFGITASSVHSMADSVRVVGQSMARSDIVQRYAAKDFARAADMILARQELLEEIEAMLAQNPNVYGLAFMREDGSVFGSLPYRTYFLEDRLPEFIGEDIYDRIRSIGRGQTVWIGPVSGQALYRLGNFEKAPEQVMLSVSYNQSLRSGVIYSMVVVDVQKLGRFLDLQSDGRSSFYLMTADGVQLAQSGSSVPIHPESRNAAQGGGRLGSASVETDGGERCHVSWRKITALNWYLVRELPMTEYDKTVNQLQAFVIRSALCLFAAAMLVYLIWLGGFMKSFKALRSAIRRLGEGRLETRIEKPFVITEFEEIRREFNDMNRELETLVQTTRAMERNQLELELRALQTQLSPHMIFNSITAIRWMASMLGAERVSDMLMELSEMLRPVFRDWAIEWTLEEELKHLSHYAKLLDLRYGNNFTMSVDVPEEMLSIRLPRFTLQPLVENSCEHGGASSAKLHVSVTAQTEKGRAVLCVRDNGTGVEQETIDAIHTRLAERGPSKRVGLYSVYNRLRICMGDSSRVVVSSPPEGGTEVTVSWEILSNQ